MIFTACWQVAIFIATMQSYDVMMLLVLVAATIFGFWKGMAWQIASLASLVASYFASLRFSEQLAPMFAQTFGLQPPLNRFAAMLAIYVGASFFIWTLFRFVSGAINKVRLESFDKQLGAMIGFAKGVLLCVAITFFAVVLLPQPQGQAIVNSQSGRYIVALLDKSHSVFPPELHQIVDPYLNKVEERLNPNYQPHGQDLQQLWQNQVKANAPAGLPQIPWPQAQTQTPQQQFAWPTTPSPQPGAADSRDPYGLPREPQAFPGPYSAEVPAGRDY